jgi:SAM-dependent methyltransferase
LEEETEMSLFAKDPYWELQKVTYSNKPEGLCLHLGSHKFLVPGWVNVDVGDFGQDMKWDLNNIPWPWVDDSVDEIVAHNVFEHLDDINSVMKECHRILKNGGRVRLVVPHAFYKGTYQDPTHKRGFSFETFDYYTPKRPYGYFDFEFSSVHTDMWLPKGLQLWNWIIEPIINISDTTKVLFEITPLKVFLNGDLCVEMIK